MYVSPGLVFNAEDTRGALLAAGMPTVEARAPVVETADMRLHPVFEATSWKGQELPLSLGIEIPQDDDYAITIVPPADYLLGIPVFAPTGRERARLASQSGKGFVALKGVFTTVETNRHEFSLYGETRKGRIDALPIDHMQTISFVDVVCSAIRWKLLKLTGRRITPRNAD